MLRFLRTSKKSDLEDAELLDAFHKHQDLKHVAILFDRYLEYIYGICLKYCKNEHTARDLTMEFFEKLPVKIHKRPINNFKSWLYVVTKNHCLGHLRQNRKKTTAPLSELIMHSPELMHHEGSFDEVEDYAGLYACVGKLPKPQKQCIELFYFEGNSYQEIAGMLAVEKDKVRSYIQNGRRNLKSCLERNTGNGST